MKKALIILMLALSGCGRNRPNADPPPQTYSIPLPPQPEGMSDEEWLGLVSKTLDRYLK
jgi:hypothetical protein